MKKSVHSNNELDLMDLLKILISKIKIIVCVALIAAIVGGAIGAAITFLSKRDFGTQVEFYITPGSPDSEILHLLSSERFAEQLLLDENGLPHGSEGEAHDAAVVAKQAADAALIKLDEAKKASKEAPRELAVVQKTYEEKQKAYDDVYNLLSVYQSASDTIADKPENLEKIKKYENLVEIAKAEKEVAEKEYYAVSQKVLEANHRLEAAKEDATETKNIADDLAEDILVAWRNQDDNKQKISDINKCIEYEYIEIDPNTVKTGSTSNYQFLTATISVPKDEALANTLLTNLCQKLPEYVEANIESAELDVEINCVLISTAAEVENLAKNSLVKEMVKFGLIATIGALAITCILVMWIGVKKLDEEEVGVYAENGDINAPLV